MRFKKAIAIALSALSLIGLGGCSDESCKHEYYYTIIKEATCRDKGEMEGICAKCGAKNYQEIAVDKSKHDYVWETVTAPQCETAGLTKGTCSICNETTTAPISAIGHEYVDGICSKCYSKEPATYLPTGKEVGVTLDDVVSVVGKFNNNISSNYDLINWLNRCNVTNVYLKNSKMFFEIDYDKNLNFWYGVEKTDVTNVAGTSDRIITFNVRYENDGYALKIIYFDGTAKTVGHITSSYGINLIKKITVNTNNELLIIFNDNEVRKCGTLSPAPAEVDESVLIYEKENGDEGYTVIGCFDNTLETVTIPKTHKGLPVTNIGPSAFAHMAYLKTVALSENVLYIGSNAFYFCNNIANVNYKGTQEDKKSIRIIASGNDTLINANWNYLG